MKGKKLELFCWIFELLSLNIFDKPNSSYAITSYLSPSLTRKLKIFCFNISQIIDLWCIIIIV
jgi:hypothetical protein